ncbi:MAG: hypothetical protein ACC645_20550 [Pirellulales bacterium]
MAKRKPKSPIEGRWNIVSMTEWNEEFLHEEAQAFIEFGPKGTGEFHFSYVQGQMDYRATEKDGKPAAEFTWDGFDEMDPESGYGWAAFEGDSLTGVLAFDDGDESGFTAERGEPKSARKRK